MPDWRQHHANESEKVLVHGLVQDCMTELAENLGAVGNHLVLYGISKVASAAAQVARAQALGFDADLLRLSHEESSTEILNLAEEAARRGVPVWTITATEASDA